MDEDYKEYLDELKDNTENWEQYIIGVNAFEGDFGDPNDRELKDKIVTTRKECRCHFCGKIIRPKSRVRKNTWVFHNEIHTYAFCKKCCIGEFLMNGRIYESEEDFYMGET